jgi:hypothetical protein
MAKKATKKAEQPKCLGATYEAGRPEDTVNWRVKMEDRGQMLNYLKTGERYWFGESYGSEKRQKPA